MKWDAVCEALTKHLAFSKHLSACNTGTQVQSLGQEDPLEKGMATHSSILAWQTSWTEEPSGLQFMGPQRVGHNWATNTFHFEWISAVSSGDQQLTWTFAVQG